MKTVYSIEEMSALSAQLKAEGNSIGFVHCHGDIHRGHAMLLKTAQAENDATVLCLIPPEGAPADIVQDSRKAEASGADILFLPQRKQLLPASAVTFVQVGELGNRLAGIKQPDHFRHLTTLTLKLLHIIDPDHVYYGQKDVQRYVIINRLVAELQMQTQIHCLPTVRDQDNIALGGSAAQLDAEQRRQAGFIYTALQTAEQLFAAGERSAGVILQEMKKELRKALLGDIVILQAVDMVDLLPLERLKSPSLIALTLSFDGLLLHDNTILE